MSAPELRELQQSGKAREQIEGWANSGANLAGGSEPLARVLAFGGPLDYSGGRSRGRVCGSMFGGDRSVIGRDVYFNSNKATVVGIMLQASSSRQDSTSPRNAWVPMQLSAQSLTRRGSHFLNLIAHLRVTGFGLRAALYFPRVHAPLYRPGVSQILSNAPPITSALQRAFRTLESEIDQQVRLNLAQ